MSDWLNYAEKRPDKAGWYWWRVPAKDYGGLTLRPEWVDEMRPYLCQPDNINPGFSHWNGCSTTVPSDLEWRVIDDGGKEGDVKWPGFNALPCPFCGNQPEIKWTPYFVGGRVFQAIEHIHLKCCAVKIYDNSLKDALAYWNNRFPESQPAPAKGENDV